MKLQITKGRIIKWGLITVALGGAVAFYLNDHEAPVLESVSFSASELNLAGDTGYLEFSGRVTDSRGISTVQLQCIEDSQVKIMVHLALSGSFRNRVSFGLDETTYNWRGAWKGTRYDLSFKGVGNIPAGTPATNCQWHAKLEDELGNESFEPLGQSLTIRS